MTLESRQVDMAALPQPAISVREQYDLSGRTVVVSGGAGFLGLHFAEAVAEMGGFPILLDVDAAALSRAADHLNSKGIDCDGFEIELTDRKSVAVAVAEIEARHERVDVLINAAAFAMKNMKEGGEGFFESFEDYAEDLWQVVLDVNLTGTFLVTQAIGKIMRRQGKGAIVNLASDVAIVSPDHRIYAPNSETGYSGVPFNTPLSYSVTKAGILAFTRYLATYWAPHGIRVNSFSPAGVFRDHDPAFVGQLASLIPLGRMAFPQEYKGPIVFLSSDASSFMTGANLVVDGGRTIW
jgi:NAD(P)-dependent dehydrogenase (short-subunit alcohol dehydrogenase family)